MCRALSGDVGGCRRHVHLNGRAGKHIPSRRNFSKILSRNGAITTSGFGRHIGFVGVFRCRALSGGVGWCRRHVHLNARAAKHVSSRRNFSKYLSRNGDLTTSGFRPPYWKWKFMKIVKMSTDCNPRLTAYYRKLTYCLHICYFRHYWQESYN